MRNILSIILLICIIPAFGQKVERLPYGDFENWVTRQIKESKLLGGNTKYLYEVAPTRTATDGKPYVNEGGSPWATSNVLASPAGVTKTSNAVYPDDRERGGRCARLTSQLENCKVLGVVNLDVMVAGSMFLGEMIEPIKSTSNPYSKMVMGIAFDKRPVAVVYDYKLVIPEGVDRIYSSGFSKKRTIPGSDCAEVFILLQRRWEDADGNLYAKRVGTGREHLTTSTDWRNGHRLEVNYGDITQQPFYKSYMGLIPDDHSYYARNSKGKMVPVHEIGWDSADATPTHIILMFSAGSGDAYIGTPGQTLWVDNVGLEY